MSSRLLLQIHELMQMNPKSFSSIFDLEIICSDGIVHWNQFLMAALSSMMRNIMKNEDEFFSLILPDVSTSSVRSALEQSVNPNHGNQNMSEDNQYIFKLIKVDSSFEPCKLLDKFEPQLESGSKKVFKCDFDSCSAKFVRRIHLERHQTKHKINQLNEKLCDLCGKVFYHDDNLKLHIRYHQDIEKNYSCTICQKTFKGRRSLHCHMSDCHASKDQCPICKRLIKRRFLPRHMRIKHPNERVRTRDIETTTIKNKDLSKSNNQSSDAVQDLIENQMKRIKCPNCEKTFSNQYNAKYHNERAHLKLESNTTNLLSCSVCEKKFKGPPSRLARHLREVHAENRFECSECGHFFPVKASLERHLKTVHNPTKVNCPYCPVEVVHIAAHLAVAHGIDSNASRAIASEIVGKSAARTNIPFSAN